jgi:hypothetical protein
MEENMLNICGIYDGDVYFTNEEDAERDRINNDLILLYLIGVGTCVSWVFKRFFFKKLDRQIITKQLPSGSECIIMCVEIKSGEYFYQCELCTQVYLKDSLDAWFEKKIVQICPHCQTQIINTNVIYENK